jgi:hypothetical protein
VKYENNPHYAVLKACACGSCNKNRVACGCADCLPYATKGRKKRKKKAKELNAAVIQASKLAAADEIINGDPGLRAKAAVPLVTKAAGSTQHAHRMTARMLERTWRTSENPAEREYAYKALAEYNGRA